MTKQKAHDDFVAALKKQIPDFKLTVSYSLKTARVSIMIGNVDLNY